VEAFSFISHRDRHPSSATCCKAAQAQTATAENKEVIASGFTVYNVSLAVYDMFPILAVQPGQTTALQNPSSFEVYVDSNTQMLNSNAIAPGNVLRFNGLIFNDSGTARMVSVLVNDGVAQ
jgi:hypothetical protein